MVRDALTPCRPAHAPARGCCASRSAQWQSRLCLCRKMLQSEYVCPPSPPCTCVQSQLPSWPIDVVKLPIAAICCIRPAAGQIDIDRGPSLVHDSWWFAVCAVLGSETRLSLALCKPLRDLDLTGFRCGPPGSAGSCVSWRKIGEGSEPLIIVVDFPDARQGRRTLANCLGLLEIQAISMVSCYPTYEIQHRAVRAYPVRQRLTEGTCQPKQGVL